MTAFTMHTRTIRPAAMAALLFAGAALSACETTGGGPVPQAAAAPPQPMTHQQAALDCWMATEKDAAHMTLDRRADVVDQCIAAKMKGEAGSPDKAAARPDAGPKAGAKPKS
jgi:hypothetical protein